MTDMTQARTGGWTLPARYYWDPAIFAKERDRIFFRSWIYAGHAKQIAEAGSYLTLDILDQGIVLLRGHDGAIRGFHNVCQHRGHRLLEGRGRVPVVTCPYHAWAYGLEGELRAARGSEKVSGFDPARFGLKPVRVEEMLGFLFVNLDRDATPFAEQAVGLADQIRERAPWLDRLVPINDGRSLAPEDAGLDCNWKVLLDNCTECYHCSTLHPAFVDLVDIETYRIEVHPLHTLHTATSTRPRNKAYGYGGDTTVTGVAFWHVWPNLTLGLMPGSPNFVAFVIDPVAPERTGTRGDHFVLPGPETDEDKARHAYTSGPLWVEDKAICESVQRGLRSKGYDRGRFILNDRRHDLSEHVLDFFQSKVLAALEG
jgi:choline monooxygenase